MPTHTQSGSAAHTLTYYGHSNKDESGEVLHCETWQKLSAHLQNVASLAAGFANPFGMAPEARLAGLLHDLGKYSERFQFRLRDPSIRGINHWSMGALRAQQLHALEAAFAIEGHHTGIPALLVDDSPSGLESLKNRLSRIGKSGSQEINGFPESLADLLSRHEVENPKITAHGNSLVARDFQSAFKIRMLFSALVDADYLDTESHFSPDLAKRRHSTKLSPHQALEVLLMAIRSKSTAGAVNAVRQSLLQNCLDFAHKPKGVFTLTAPTGSGKTLSSLAFALAHAAEHNLRRVIVVIPFTSIIEQTAQVFRSILAPVFGSEYVLEHHSASNPECFETSPESIRNRLAVENWDAPLVVTTSVQFFESLFSHKPAPCRKLHNIAESVVLFDEVQTLPLRLVPSLLSAVNLLSKECAASVVFGSATQPAFLSAYRAIEGGWSPLEINSRSNEMAKALIRTRISVSSEKKSWPTIADSIAAENQILCIVNLKRHAEEIFRLLDGCAGAFHLSTNLCPEHRRQKLAMIRECLMRGEPCRLISTQLIEAGVDLDFPKVFRAMAPLDSIIQSAGRCNREGRSIVPGDVLVFTPEDHGLPSGSYSQATAITTAFFNENPDIDLHSPHTYAKYFSRLYGTLGPAEKNEDPVFKASAELNFPEAARSCRLIAQGTKSVAVRYQAGEELIKKMRLEKHLERSEWRILQHFSVSFYESAFQKGLARGVIVQPHPDIDFYFWNGVYDQNLGVTEPTNDDFNL
jgi:CRISPR-associated helicase Cas3/CRISPR-associated endonuclease Cas3-HD